MLGGKPPGEARLARRSAMPSGSWNAQNLQGVLCRQQGAEPSPGVQRHGGTGSGTDIFGQARKPQSRQQRSNRSVQLRRKKWKPRGMAEIVRKKKP